MPAPASRPEPDEALVRRLLRDQFPHVAHLPLHAARPQGWDNRTFRLGPDLVAAWTIVDAATRPRFARAVGLDRDTWDRARGWAVWKAAITLVDPKRVAGHADAGPPDVHRPRSGLMPAMACSTADDAPPRPRAAASKATSANFTTCSSPWSATWPARSSPSPTSRGRRGVPGR